MKIISFFSLNDDGKKGRRASVSSNDAPQGTLRVFPFEDKTAKTPLASHSNIAQNLDLDVLVVT